MSTYPGTVPSGSNFDVEFDHIAADADDALFTTGILRAHRAGVSSESALEVSRRSGLSGTTKLIECANLDAYRKDFPNHSRQELSP